MFKVSSCLLLTSLHKLVQYELVLCVTLVCSPAWGLDAQWGPGSTTEQLLPHLGQVVHDNKVMQ